MFLQIERGKLKKIANSVRNNDPASDRQRFSFRSNPVASSTANLASSLKRTSIFKKQAARMNDATKLSFFGDAARHGTRPLGLWWMICSFGLQKKLDTKHYHRTLLEVAMLALGLAVALNLVQGLDSSSP